MRVLGISAGLREASINSALLRAARQLAPPGMHLRVLDGVGELPLFNPDLELNLPVQVRVLRAAIVESDALVLASPEYAHGVTGVIKNTLDWLVSFEPFAGKCVAVLNASPRAHHANSALRETLKTMSAVVVEGASLSIPLLGAKLSDAGMVADPLASLVIKRALSALQAAFSHRQFAQG
jgi:NAD(P)H-dependent FMN reductase